MNFNKTLITLVLASLLGACGGNDGSGGFFEGSGDGGLNNGGGAGGGTGGGTGGSSSGGGGGGGGASTTNVSYLPLLVYEAYSEFSGADSDGIFTSYKQDPFINSFLINPIDSTTLAPVSNATADDYQVTVDNTLIDDTESYPMLQKVIGTPVFLRTALVFDLSDSVQTNVNMSELIEEAKAYVAAAQLSENPIIANQEFVVWGFGSSVAGFDADDVSALDDVDIDAISDPGEINDALDEVLVAYNEKTLGTGTNLHRAVVQAVGRYSDDDYDFGLDGTNDLRDFACMDFINVSQMVVFSSGPDTYLEMPQTLMERAISSQSFVKYDETSTTRDTLRYLNKPVFYYVMGGSTAGTAYTPLSAKAEEVTSLRLQEGEYTFANDLIEDQIAAIDARIDLDNQYVYRFAFVPRIGDHTRVFKSNASGYNYALTGQYSAEALSDPENQGTPSQELDSLVEITGPNGEYLSLGMADIEEVDEFAPATRWTNTVYTAANYTWSAEPGITGSPDSNGRYTVTDFDPALAALDPDGLQLTVTNTVRNESASITLYDSVIDPEI